MKNLSVRPLEVGTVYDVQTWCLRDALSAETHLRRHSRHRKGHSQVATLTSVKALDVQLEVAFLESNRKISNNRQSGS